MKTVVCCVACLLFAVSSMAEMWIWTSKKGDAVEAEFIKMFGTKGALRRADGKEIKVPLSGLSAKDQVTVHGVMAAGVWRNAGGAS